MKRIAWILSVGSLALVSPVTAQVQDEAPSAEIQIPPPPTDEAPPPQATQLAPPQVPQPIVVVQAPMQQLAGPHYAPMFPPGRPPRPPRTQRKNWELIGGGIGMFVGSWLATWVGTSIWYGETTSCSSTGWFGYTCTHFGPDDYALAVSFVPLAGPWLMLGSDNLSGGDYVFPIIAGLAQTAGLVVLIVGLTVPVALQPRARLGDDPTAPTLRAGLVSERGGGRVTATIEW